MKKIYLADDHVLVAQGFAGILQELGYKDVQVFNSGKSLHKAMLHIPPDIIFLDVFMTDWDGITTLKQIRSEHKGIPVLIISMMWERSIVENCLALGANAFLHKSCTKDEISDALNCVLDNRVYISDKISMMQRSKAEINYNNYKLTEPLSSREMEVLVLLCEGLNYSEVATQLFISINTVETHKKKLLQKFGVNSVSKMIALAYKNKIIQ